MLQKNGGTERESWERYSNATVSLPTNLPLAIGDLNVAEQDKAQG
jgi:hypothetical protein